ncbi:YdcF family protein [Flavobacterium agricola]|uniref:YdcF family protein n=1 Tax=Flavobacterium agricola TaxID=2870839 RepID=A0ABY6M141_9FLAO|nr:ElyC/SanA/YdcF family protein [Flavobacterium agricola]UYW00593.1 YdcF family protein [Flavobacterium agricola]
MKFKIKLFLFICVLIIGSIIYCDAVVTNQAQNKVYETTETIPYNKVGLLLGTGKYLKNGAINPYYANRITAAAALYHANKISTLVISGDNSTPTYNEPQSMMDDLLALGIPAQHMYLDYAGFRTLDSVYRLQAIFGQQQFTVISQKFHNERALFIADYLGLNGIGYNAADVSAKQGLKTNLREKLARVKVFIDKFVDKEPKFQGEKINIS